jgi:hypothetical protein
MKITIQNFRGLSDLEASVAPILLLGGSNAAGKSSACTAIGAVAAGALLPFDGLTKGKAALLVHDGQERATASIHTDEGEAVAAWPAVERSTQGRFRDASLVAAGLEDLTAMKPAERAGRLIALIGAEPTDQDLTAALAEADVPAETAKEVWKQVAKGWDAAHAYYKDEGAKLKGSWERLTSERFGSSKALTWRPKDWALNLEGASIEQLETCVSTAETVLDKVKRKSGADEAAVKRLQAEVDALPGHREERAEAERVMDTKVRALATANKALAALGLKPSEDKPLRCPCCDRALEFHGGALREIAVADMTDEHRALRIAAFDEAEKAVKVAHAERDKALSVLEGLSAKVAAGEAAEKKLNEMPQGEAVSDEAIEAARGELSRHQRNLAMKRQVIESMQLVERIQKRIAIVGLLDKSGLRQKVLVERLGAFNGRLVENCRTAGWAPVHIDADMSISYGGRPLSLCSGGEQFRTRVTLQMTIAESEEAPLVIVDGADILDKAGRNGLFSLIRALGIPAVIGMTILKREEMPDLARANLGASVWIENGAAASAMQVAA